MPRARSIVAARAGGDGSLSGAVAEIDIDDADGFERRQGFSGGKIKACGLELFFDGAVDQQGERGDVDVRLHAVVGPVTAACREHP
jgi:hypothetical protein